MDVDTTEKTNNSFEASVFPDLLPVYYQRLFPYDLYFKWLNYNDEKKNVFMNREFSFTLKDDVYLRYQSFKDDAEMKKEMLQKCPYKIDIGAVYSHRPRESRTVASFRPLEKQLVFDIDMTDYDEVRTCCSGADICKKCWPFMTIAMKILNRALTEDFGFKHILWIYSGRRGVHCWVCDENACKLSSVARSAIVEYLSLVKGGEYRNKKVVLPEILHPSISAASDIIQSYFEDLMLVKQDILSTTEYCEKVASLCSDANVRDKLKTHLPNFHSSIERWRELLNVEDVVGNKKTTRSKHFALEVMFQMCYPRLDENVSKGINHLLKAPFCVHPKTGRVCVPIDISRVDSFDPFSVPTISQLCNEIDSYDAKNAPDKQAMDIVKDGNLNESEGNKKIKDCYKTSLKKSIKIFETFVKNLISDISSVE